MVKKLDRWCDINWLIFICVTGVVTAVCAAIFWNQMPLGAQAGVFAAVIMPFHVLEEWKFPGGLHFFYNRFFGPKDPKKQDASRYPMSRLTDMVTNICLQWIPLIYLLLSCVAGLSNATALCIMFFSFGEVLAHTAVGFLSRHWYREEGKKTIYDPGFATSYMMFLPAGIYLAVHLHGITVQDWIWFAVLFVILLAVSVPLTETPLKKWVRKQEKGVFAFENPKYFSKFVQQK